MRKVKTETKNNEIALTILKAIGMAALATGTIVFPGLAHIINWVEKQTGDSSFRTRRSFKGLQQRGMIRVTTTTKRASLTITSKGKRWLQRKLLKKFRPNRKSIWDGKWRIIMFDIPESRREARDFIRIVLRDASFIKIQKSAFACPYPCFEFAEHLKEELELHAGELYLFEAKALTGEKELRRITGISV